MFDPKFLQFQIRKYKMRLSELENIQDFKAARSCAKQIEDLQKRLHSGLINYHKELKRMEEYNLYLKQRKQELMNWFDHMTTYDQAKEPSDIRGYMLIGQHYSNDIVSDFTAIDDCKDLVVEEKLHPQIIRLKNIPKGYRFYSINNVGMLVLIGESLDSGD